MPEPQACIEARSPAVKYNPLMKKHYTELCEAELKKQKGKGGRRRGTKKAGRRQRRKTTRR